MHEFKPSSIQPLKSPETPPQLAHHHRTKTKSQDIPSLIFAETEIRMDIKSM
jgi:hypothetical protein